MKIFVVVLCLFICSSSAVKLPQTFPRCKVSSELDNKPNECLQKAVQEAIIQLSDEGNSELGAIDLDPLKINKMSIVRGDSSPIAIKLQFTDNELAGLKNLQVKSIKGKLSTPEHFEMVMETFTDKLVLKGPYSISGRVLILPIQGVGQSVMKMDKLKARITIKGEPLTKNGKEYLKVSDFKLEMYDLERLYMSFTNLFNGDKVLGDNMNKFLNENWKDIFTELKPSIEGAFRQVFDVYTKRIMERVQFKNIFLLD